MKEKYSLIPQGGDMKLMKRMQGKVERKGAETRRKNQSADNRVQRKYPLTQVFAFFVSFRAFRRRNGCSLCSLWPLW